METAPPEGSKLPLPSDPTGSAATLVTTDFLLKSLQLNTEQIIKSFTSNLGALALKIDSNTMKIDDNTEMIKRQAEAGEADREEIRKLSARMTALESGTGQPRATPGRAVLSPEYLKARRAIRLWPVLGADEGQLWGNVGDFLHDTMRVPTTDVNQNDIEDVQRVPGGRGDVVRDEVVVTFKDKDVRDKVMSWSVNLADCIDAAGRPTAGTRLEVPDSLMDTFRLLSRFGTRLRARHGTGKKRHIKFDDYSGSLFTNVKLPGDHNWTRVSPEMARNDLEDSVREENRVNQRRLAAKLIPGPRERLANPLGPVGTKPRGLGDVGLVPGANQETAMTPASRGQAGSRERWIAPPAAHQKIGSEGGSSGG